MPMPTSGATTANHHIVTVIVAAGSGSRFGGDLPKQFTDLCGRPVLMHTVEAFRRAIPGGRIIVVLSPRNTGLWASLCQRHNFTSPQVVSGGDTRWQSVRNALAEVTSTAKVILVHDGARPLVDAPLIQRVAHMAGHGGVAVVPVVPVTDSLRRTDTNQAVDRSLFCAVQTPQGFDALTLLEAYNAPFRAEFTDDASVVESAGYHVTTVCGSPENIKITYPADILWAEAVLAARNKK